MKLFKSKKTKYSNLRGKVQCNEDCYITLSDGREIKARVCELNWVGFIVDYIPDEYEEELHEHHHDQFDFKFKLPREFGNINIKTTVLQILKYNEVITNESCIKMIVNIEDKPELEMLQEFIHYRNRRFARHGTSRKSITFLKSSSVLKVMYLIAGVFLLAYLVSYYYIKYYNS